MWFCYSWRLPCWKSDQTEGLPPQHTSHIRTYSTGSLRLLSEPGAGLSAPPANRTRAAKSRNRLKEPQWTETPQRNTPPKPREAPRTRTVAGRGRLRCAGNQVNRDWTLTPDLRSFARHSGSIAGVHFYKKPINPPQKNSTIVLKNQNSFVFTDG